MNNPDADFQFERKVNPPKIIAHKPADDLSKDYVGMTPYVDLLSEAVEVSTFVGLLASYGTGKSTIIEQFKASKRNNKSKKCKSYKFVPVNLWGNLEIENSTDSSKENGKRAALDLARRNLLYQLAFATKDGHLIHYIETLLSRRYNRIGASAPGKNSLRLAVTTLCLLMLVFVPKWYMSPFFGLSFFFFIAIIIALGFFLMNVARDEVSVSYMKADADGEISQGDYAHIYELLISKLSHIRHSNPIQNFIQIIEKINLRVLRKSKEENVPDYIVIIIDDADRLSSCDLLLEFLRELKVIVESSSMRDKVKVIVGASSEKIKGAATKDEGALEKIFDTTLYLHRISNDDLSLMLNSFLAENEAYYRETEAGGDDVKKVALLLRDFPSLRTLKRRVSAMNTTHYVLQSRFTKTAKESISLSKCALAVYLIDCYQDIMDALNFSVFVELHLAWSDTSSVDTVTKFVLDNLDADFERDFEPQDRSKRLSDFCEIIYANIMSGTIDSQFGLYISNAPSTRNVMDNAQMSLYNCILRDQNSEPILSDIGSADAKVAINQAFDDIYDRALDVPELLIKYPSLLSMLIDYRHGKELFDRYLGRDNRAERISEILRMCAPAKLGSRKDSDWVYETVWTNIISHTSKTWDKDNYDANRRLIISAAQDNVMQFTNLFTPEYPLLKEDLSELTNDIALTNIAAKQSDSISPDAVPNLLEFITKDNDESNVAETLLRNLSAVYESHPSIIEGLMIYGEMTHKISSSFMATIEEYAKTHPELLNRYLDILELCGLRVSAIVASLVVENEVRLYSGWAINELFDLEHREYALKYAAKIDIFNGFSEAKWRNALVELAHNIFTNNSDVFYILREKMIAQYKTVDAKISVLFRNPYTPISDSEVESIAKWADKAGEIGVTLNLIRKIFEIASSDQIAEFLKWRSRDVLSQDQWRTISMRVHDSRPGLLANYDIYDYLYKAVPQNDRGRLTRKRNKILISKK